MDGGEDGSNRVTLEQSRFTFTYIITSPSVCTAGKIKAQHPSGNTTFTDRPQETICFINLAAEISGILPTLPARSTAEIFEIWLADLAISLHTLPEQTQIA